MFLHSLPSVTLWVMHILSESLFWLRIWDRGNFLCFESYLRRYLHIFTSDHEKTKCKCPLWRIKIDSNHIILWWPISGTLLLWFMAIFLLQIICSSGAWACNSFPLVDDWLLSVPRASGSDSAQKDRPKQRPSKVRLQGQHSSQTG